MTREPERARHTAVGWWFMTRDVRTQSALLGTFAIVVLAGDLVYVATRWRGTGSPAGRGFEAGLGLCVLTLALSGLTRLPVPLASPRDRQRFAAAIAFAGFAITMWLLNRLADTTAGILGLVAGIALLLIVMSVRWLIRPKLDAKRR